MRKFGLIGYPLGHSFSRQYFTDKFSTEGIRNCRYDNYPLEKLELLPGLLSSDKSIEGLNVTIPYKSEILKYVNFVDHEAESVGAVNVLKIKRDGDNTVIRGFNSDVTGVFDTLLPYISQFVKKALILGTGGSSKAVSYVLKNLGIEFTKVSRSIKQGCLTYGDITDEILESAQLIINTTPLGMFPNTANRPDLRYYLLGENHILFDLVYNPEYTLFLKSGLERGCKVITGLKMLHSQAERSWEIWNDDHY